MVAFTCLATQQKLAHQQSKNLCCITNLDEWKYILSTAPQWYKPTKFEILLNTKAFQPIKSNKSLWLKMHSQLISVNSGSSHWKKCTTCITRQVQNQSESKYMSSNYLKYQLMHSAPSTHTLNNRLTSSLIPAPVGTESCQTHTADTTCCSLSPYTQNITTVLCHSIPGLNIGLRSFCLGHPSYSGLPSEPYEEWRSQEEGGNSSRGNWVVWQRENWCPADEKGLKQEGATSKK